MSVTTPVLVANDLTPASDAAILHGHALARAASAPLLVCHVIPDVLRHHPLLPTPGESDAGFASDLMARAADMCTDQVCRVTGLTPDDFDVDIESGDAEDEIVRLAEEKHARLVVVGAKIREGTSRVLGHVAERVVRYAHIPVLIARDGKRTGKVLVATDFAEDATPALEAASNLVKAAKADATLLHVMQLPASMLAVVGGPLGSSWSPPSKSAVDRLESLGRETLEGLAKQYGFQHFEQVEGDPAVVITERANALDAELIIVGSKGRTGLARLVLGSTAERVVRDSNRSVFVAR